MAKPKFQIDDVKAKAVGLWETTIFPSFGIDVFLKKNKPCPACGGRDRFRYDDKFGNGDYNCRGCNGGDGFSLVEKCTGYSFPKVIEEIAAIVGLDATSNITDADREQWRKDKQRRNKERLERELQMQEQIARKAEGIFRNAYLGESSLYLIEKQVDKDPKIKITHDGNLLIPAYDEHGKMWNVQTITPDGQKFFITDAGGRTGGCFFIIGEVQPDLYDAYIICIAEGYATGMSIHMATGHPVALSFVANNLPKVGTALRQKYPNAVFAYCADDDSAKESTGQKYANEALEITGGIVVLPDFTQIQESIA